MESLHAPRVNVLGTGISALNMSGAVQIITAAIQEGRQCYVCVAAAHSVMACWRDPQLRRIFNSSLITTPDGMPLVWLSRFKGYSHVERVYGPDLMLALCGHSMAKGYTHFLYGGGPGVAEGLSLNLRRKFAGLIVSGTFTPPYRALSLEEDSEVVEIMNRADPDIVWIGLGTGKQERWMHDHAGRIKAPVMIGVGAAFDFLSGQKRQAPGWVRRSGLEWLFRWVSEPRRLWRRYAEYPLFLALILAQLAGIKRFEMED